MHAQHIRFHGTASIHRALRTCMLLALACLCGVLAPGALTLAQAGERCFGAVGQACGAWTNNSAMPSMAFCVHTNGIGTHQGVCLINGGSMAHDPCCAASPNGEMCGGNGSSGRNACKVEWNRAVSRTLWGYNWKRVLDVTRVNDSGVVERPLYCARPGRGVHKNDEAFCCSGSARPAKWWERVGRPNLNVCL
ncbi:hypothetical protein [Pseudoxanthomonas composti]|uniref:Uncharacterized protein n=1 Tax=Pseudoxanthomonas composti TaxID=2137479 RepID=A0A4Q1JZV3_9GAMM|nr:hypothetical protein [Pseudoxanthomonas composti]RXR08291.1 hypothetical protein EPA99_00190 [Pseudoxanthomonas composti]